MTSVRLFDDASEFAAAVRPYVEAHPAEATVLATVVSDVLAGARTYPGASWFCVEDSRGVAGVAMQTPPHRLWVSPMSDEAAAQVAEAVAERLDPGELPGIAGEERAAEAARQRWNLLRPDEHVRPVRRVRLYVLGSLRPPQDVPGAARVVAEDDLDLLLGWWDAFTAEAEVVPTPARDAVEPRLRGHGALLVWELDGRPVAMAGHSVTVAGTARIGPVYTPPEDRRRGFGAAVTAAATQHSLAAGTEQVVLFTDLGNPVSNSIYQQIGFRPVRDYVEMDVEPAG